MDLTRKAYKIFTAVFLATLISGQAQANEPLSPLNLKARYLISWGGITIGRINITAREDATSYSLVVDTKTHGAGSIVSNEANVVEANGTKTADGTYIPVRYHSAPQGKHKDDTIDLTYDAKGDIVKRVREPDDDPNWRPPVPFVEINTARDPITASFMLRKKLYAAIADANSIVSNRTYDGSRLAQMKMTRAPNAKVAVMDSYKNAVNVVVTREPINGYTPKELKKYAKGDPEIHLYFSDDAAFLPIRASAKLQLGELALTMVDDNAN